MAQSAKFIASINAKEPWTRQFCGGVGLVALVEPKLADAPVWNVIADASVIDGHGDLLNPRLLDSVRQLFEDTEFDQTQLSGLCVTPNVP